MRITILGCGPSYGVPDALSGYGDCDPNNPKNNRSRTGALIQTDETTLLIDTPPELRMQLYKAQVKKIDAILWTHDHSDHLAGVDDVKGYAFWKKQEKTIPIYATEEMIGFMKNKYGYLFEPLTYMNATKPTFQANTLIPFQETLIGDIALYPILQDHGAGETSMGFRIGDFAYNSDVFEILGRGLDELQGVKTWVLGCMSYSPRKKHLYIERMLKWVDSVKPERVFLTHMGNELDYETLCRELPPHIRPAYDGLVIDI